MVQTQTFTTSDGAKIGYQIHGSAPGVPLVLINGLSAVLEDWSPLVEHLAKERKVLIFDHRGIGQSYVPDDWDWDMPMELMAKDIVSLVASLGWKTIDILGFSMGGHIAQTILIMDETTTTPEGRRELFGVQVRKAVLTATMTKLPRGDLKLEELQAEAESYSDRTERNRFISTEMMKYQYHPEVLSPGTEMHNKFSRRVEVSLNTRRPAQIIGAQFMAIRGQRLADRLNRVPPSVPVLVIHGHRDRMVKYDESDLILQGIKHAKRFVPPQGSEFGHFWYDYFSIDMWSDAISRFLDDGPAGQAAKL